MPHPQLEKKMLSSLPAPTMLLNERAIDQSQTRPLFGARPSCRSSCRTLAIRPHVGSSGNLSGQILALTGLTRTITYTSYNALFRVQIFIYTMLVLDGVTFCCILLALARPEDVNSPKMLSLAFYGISRPLSKSIEEYRQFSIVY